MTHKIFIDTNVVLDLLLNREPFALDAINLFSLVDAGFCEACVSSLTICNTAYVLKKSLGIEETFSTIQKFLRLVTITTMDCNTVMNSLSSNSTFKDIEDGMQYYSALNEGCGCIITRDLKDFSTSNLPVYTPNDFLIEMGF